MHLKEVIQINHVQLTLTIVVYSEWVLIQRYSVQFSLQVGADMFTSATDKRMRRSIRSGNLDYRITY